MAGRFFGGPALNRLAQRIRQQNADIDRLSRRDGPISALNNRIIRQTNLLTDKTDAGKPGTVAKALFDPKETSKICERLTYVFSDRDLFRWYDKHYGFIGAGYGLALQVPKITPIPDERRASVCGRVLTYFRARYAFATWLSLRCDEYGCRLERDVVLSQLERVLKNSPNSVVAEAYARVVRLNDVLLSMYTYIYDVLKLMVERDLSSELVAQLQVDTAKALSEYYGDCCRALRALSDFAWKQEGPDLWRNLVTGTFLSGDPPSGIRTLSGPKPGGCRYTTDDILTSMGEGCVSPQEEFPLDLVSP